MAGQEWGTWEKGVNKLAQHRRAQAGKNAARALPTTPSDAACVRVFLRCVCALRKRCASDVRAVRVRCASGGHVMSVCAVLGVCGAVCVRCANGVREEHMRCACGVRARCASDVRVGHMRCVCGVRGARPCLIHL